MDDKEIKQIVGANLHEGKTLNEIHKILADEHNVKITFMELRLLSAELEDMDWSVFDPKKEEPEESDDDLEAQEVSGEVESGTQIELHKVQRPGAMMSGSVVFLSGIKGEWYVDQFGALGLNVDDDKDPTEEDMEDFQLTLRRKLQGE